jgi:glutathione S-transferase
MNKTLMTDTTEEPRYELYYWPQIPGRGEFVRLVFEDAGAPYTDVARLPAEQGGGIPAMMAVMKGGSPGLVPLAPPFLKIGELVIAQTANICLFLARRFGMVPGDETRQAEAMQLQMTVADFVAEVHDTHHPVATGAYYEDQKPEAHKRAAQFLDTRMPKFLGYFERILAVQATRGPGRFVLGEAISCVDLSLFHIVAGLRYAFPNGFAAFASHAPHLIELHDRVADRPNIAAYLASERRLPFNQHGIFRHYPELDAD